jgi:L-aspartate oxidase
LTDSISFDELSRGYDVIIVGAGAAGLYSALCLPAHLKIAIISKDSIATESPPVASKWAQGGIAAVVSKSDSVELHIQDTLKAGDGLCDPETVRFLVENAAKCVSDLVEMGVAFDRVSTLGGDSALAMTLEAAHSRPRVLHAADTTGRTVMKVLLEQVRSRSNIQTIDPALALDLWIVEGRCQGISLAYDGKISWLRAPAVILATGGGGQVYAHTTNPEVSTGDGAAMVDRVLLPIAVGASGAIAVGASGAIENRIGGLLADLEFVQFHPTALNVPGAPRFLISEAVRGEGAYLIDDQGDRFCFQYHADGELAPRDVVSRAIFSHLAKVGGDKVYLDLRSMPPATVSHRFPNIIQVCQSWGIDVFTQPIPVSPAAHYWMGGIATDVQNHTGIPGVYAVGEASCTGVHGANRLASNSLLECLVFGGGFANSDFSSTQNTLIAIDAQQDSSLEIGDWDSQKQIITKIRQKLPLVMWQVAGIVREAVSLQAGLAQIKTWQIEFEQLSISQILNNWQPQQTAKLPINLTDLRLWAETRNLLQISNLIVRSALFRTESRGGHFRSDFAAPDSAWEKHSLVSNGVWSRSTSRKVLENSKEL